MSNENIEQTNKEYKPTVSWFLRPDRCFKHEGKNGPFYQARVFKGTVLSDGKDISNYTYTFNAEKLKEIKAYESSPDFIKDEEFREKNRVIYFNEDTNIKLTEPYDKNNPDKELQTITIKAKALSEAQKNRNRPDKSNFNDGHVQNKSIGTKERITQRTVSASQAKSDSKTINNVEKQHDVAISQ